MLVAYIFLFQYPRALKSSLRSQWVTSRCFQFVPAHSSRTCFRFICVSNTYSSVCRTAVYSDVCVPARTSLYSMWRQEVSAKCLPQSLPLPGASPAPVSPVLDYQSHALGVWWGSELSPMLIKKHCTHWAIPLEKMLAPDIVKPFLLVVKTMYNNGANVLWAVW